MLRAFSAALAAGLLAASAAAHGAPPTLDALLKPDRTTLVDLSPDGAYLVLTVREPKNGKNRVLLGVIDRATMKPVRFLDPGQEEEIASVSWVSDRRMYLRTAFAVGDFRQYVLDGALVAVNVDGSREERLGGWIIDTLPDDPEHVLEGRCAGRWHEECNSYVDRVEPNLRGGRERIADGPAPLVDYRADAAGNLRFAERDSHERVQTIWYREGGEWRVLHEQGDDRGPRVYVLGTTRDGSAAYLQRERPGMTDVVERFEFATGARTELLSDPVHDPLAVRRSADGRVPIGMAYGPGVPRARFFDPDHPDARLLRALEKQFPEDAVRFTAGSRDGRHVLVEVEGNRDPGSFYLYDREAKSLVLVARRREWLDPAAMAPTELVELKASDGTAMHGYLTLPSTVAPGRKPPLVVMPHGGPFGIQDMLGWDEEVQILAAHGYAVLRVNFRGSGGRGMGFTQSGFRQWGERMIGDINDAVRWAAADGRVDGARVCTFGASYGGYAALMAPVRAPGQYRCAIATVAPTNLVLMRKWGDIQRRRYGRNYLDAAIGTDEAVLFAQSPVAHVATLDVPVLMVHGQRDDRVPFEHARAFEKAMKDAGRPLETLYFAEETHGIYGDDNRRTYYTRVLGFLRQHLGAP